MERRLFLIMAALLFAAAACTSGTVTESGTPDEALQASGTVNALESGIKQLADGTKYLIHPDQLMAGGPPKDGIPAIDDPRFIPVGEADRWLADGELGAAIIHKGTQRFYPFQVLVWHEIVNDAVAGDPVLITYCPLCGSVIGYERLINGEEVEFGTSGKLYNSNLVMYDRLTDTYWTQIQGRAIIGELTGTELKLFPVDVVTWEDWKNAYPDSEVLSRETGHVRAYGTDPYGSYYSSRNLIFPVNSEDNRLHPKAVVFGIEIGDTAKAYPEDALKANPEIRDAVNNVSLSIVRESTGIVTITNLDAGERVPHERDFWFAWAAFHPDTGLFEP